MRLKSLCTAIALIVLAIAGNAQDNKKLEGMKDVNNVVDLTLDSLDKVRTARIAPGSSRKGHKPVLFLIGNSTMRTGTLGNGNNGQWGWGYFAEDYFDKNKITVENQALGGTSSRTFYRKLWPEIKKALHPGDWVIISIGHNDNGPFDHGRARATIKGIGKDSMEVTIQETGVKETVYSYGEYMRRFIQDTRSMGANPILMSITPRNAWDENGRVARYDTTFTLWAKQVAEEMNVPFIDLNGISSAKYEQYGPEKMNYHFYLDKIHTSRFGAMHNARCAVEGLADSKEPSLQFLQSCMVNVNPPVVAFRRTKNRPALFITGDSTVRNKDRDANGMWGWGSQAATVFDTTKITPVNCAMAGRSCRTYISEGRWEKVYNSIQPGDFVLIQFGHNDLGAIDSLKERACIPMTKDSSKVFKRQSDGKYEVVYSFGWYLRKFIGDVREKGGTPIIVTLTPRNIWKNGKIERRTEYVSWYKEVGEEMGVDVIDVHNISGDFLDKLGEKKAAAYYNHDHTHTSLKGAQMNAQSIKKGLKKVKSPLAKYLK